MSTKFQVTFPDPLMAQLKREARKLEISVAEYIRQTVEERLDQKPRAKTWTDPFESITGILDSGETDLSSKIDEILYG